MVEVITTVEALNERWTVLVQNKHNPIQEWRRSFADGLEAHSAAFHLKLIERSVAMTAFARKNRYRSEGESSIDQAVLIANGFKPREVEFRYRTTAGRANVGGTILEPGFVELPSVGKIISLARSGMNGDFKVTSVLGPFHQNGSVQFIIGCDGVTIPLAE